MPDLADPLEEWKEDEEDLALVRSLIPAPRLTDLRRYCIIYPAPEAPEGTVPIRREEA